jgi:hypothetical protein
MNTYYYSTNISFDSCYNLLIVGLTLEKVMYIESEIVHRIDEVI